jgi:predicted nucleic acid-binding protein
MELVFVDTSAWVALANRSDRHHKEATEGFRALQKRCRFLTTNLVVAETYVLLHRTLGYEAAIAFLDAVESSPKTTKFLSDEATEASAGEILRGHRDQDYSYTDAVSFAAMRSHKIQRAFAFDHHFSTAGFVRVP